MTTTTASAAQVLTDAARWVWGQGWVRKASEALRLNPRTVERINSAAHGGKAMHVPPGVLMDMAHVVRSHAESVAQSLEAAADDHGHTSVDP